MPNGSAPRSSNLSPDTNTQDRILDAQQQALELYTSGASLHDVLELLVRAVEEESPTGVIGSILLLDENSKRLRHGAAPSLPDTYNSVIDGIEIGMNVGSCGTAAYTGHTVAVSDIQSDPLWKDFKEVAAEHGLASCWSTPILSSTGSVLGTFALYHRMPNIPAMEDRSNVERLGETAALIIERSRASEAKAAV